MSEKWEYLVVTFDLPQHEHTLNRYGDDGWELVSHTVESKKLESHGSLLGSTTIQPHNEHIYIFKRRKQEK